MRKKLKAKKFSKALEAEQFTPKKSQIEIKGSIWYLGYLYDKESNHQILPLDMIKLILQTLKDTLMALDFELAPELWITLGKTTSIKLESPKQSWVFCVSTIPITYNSVFQVKIIAETGDFCGGQIMIGLTADLNDMMPRLQNQGYHFSSIKYGVCHETN